MSEIKARRLTDIISEREDRDKVLVAEVAARIANTIEAIREKEHVTLSELAQRVGSSTSQMSRVLSGEYSGISLSTLVRISAGLGYTPEVTFRRTITARATSSAAHASATQRLAAVSARIPAAQMARSGRRAG